MPATVRLFVALQPPAEWATAALASLASVALAEHRPTPVHQVHLTLVFVGDRREKDVPGIVTSLRRSAAGISAFELRPERLLTLPLRGEPRLVAVQTAAPAGLREIQSRLAHRLAEPKAKGKAFLPHLTLTRFAPGVLAEPVDVPAALPPFEVRRIQLVSSFLRASGAEHRTLATAELPAAESRRQPPPGGESA